MIKVRALLEGNAEIMIYDPIGSDWYGNGITAQRMVDDLEALGDVKDITVRINSPGGEVFDGFAIYNALKNHPAQIHVQIDGLAASIASVIAMAGDLVTMGTGAMIMIHDPWSVAWGDAEDFRGAAEMLDQIKVGIIDAYSARTGMDRDELSAMMDKETWFTVDEAIENGFADERISDQRHDTPAAAMSMPWQAVMAKFRNTPEDLHPPHNPAGSPQSAPAGATTMEQPMKNKGTASVQNADEIRAEAEREALAKDATRRTDIKNAFGRYSTEHQDLMDECCNDQKCTVDVARTKLLNKLAEGSEPLRKPDVQPGIDARDKFKTGAVNALLSRTGLEKREAGNEFNGMPLAQLAAHALSLAGISTRGLSNDGLARKVLASHTSSDFPLLLSSVAGKTLRAAYEAFPSTYQMWCAIGEVSDFKASPRIQLGSFNSLASIPEGGEYDYGSFEEESESVTAATKGKGLLLSRQMIVNDDLGGFNRRAQMMGRAAARTVNNDAYALLTSGSSNNGPTMSDTGQMFNTTAVTTAGGHKNLASSAGAPSVSTISAGRAAMRKQKDAGLNETLNIMPRSILTSVGLEDVVWALLNSTTDFSAANSGKKNYLADVARLQLVTDPYLDGISSTAWWLAADPMDAPLIEVAFLDGQQTPFIDEDIDWATDAMLLKVRLDYGLAGIDWRGGYKNAGA